MRKFMNNLVWIVSIFTMLAVILSCGKAEEIAQEQAMEAQLGEGSDVDISGDRMTVKTEDGTMEVEGDTATITSAEGTARIEGDSMTMTSADGTQITTIGDAAKIPDNFPKDIPVYPGAKVVSAMTDTAQNGFSVNLETVDAYEKVAEYVEKEMENQGWKMDAEIRTPGDPPTSMLRFTKDSRTVMYMISKTDAGASLSITQTTEAQ